jgi:Domain of unknown function (DUF1906)
LTILGAKARSIPAFCYLRSVSELLQIVMFCLALAVRFDSAGQPGTPHGYLGFDRNDYPGDAAMAELRKQFAFTGYWLTPPPEEESSSWVGKRSVLEAQHYGFLLLARGRGQRAIRSRATAERAGSEDAREAAERARSEGFAAGAVVFLDVEEGGRLSPDYHAYLRAWADQLRASGFAPGVYCSGIAVQEGPGQTIVTADDIRANEAPRTIRLWVFNDVCPPSPGCVSAANPPSASGVKDARAWQFARSPRERETAARCGGYAADRNCYPAGDAARKWFLDLDVAASANPSFEQP